MPLFRVDYSRPGRGVDKDEPELTGLSRFFTIFMRRFSKFVKLNLTFMIPFAVCVGMMVGLIFMPLQRYTLELQLSDSILRLSLWDLYVVPLPIILLMPFIFGMMVVARRLTNEEYCFIWSEFWHGVKDNWKQGLVNGVMVYIFYAVLSFAIVYYCNSLSEHWFNFIPLALVLLMLVAFLLAELYIPLLATSVKLKLIPLVKNALIFGIISLVKNLIVIVIIAGLFALLYFSQIMGLTLFAAMILVIVIFFSFIAYLVSYNCYPMIRDYIVKPYERKEKAANAPEVQKSEENFEYEHDELDDDDEEPEYVYYNGKMIKREELEEQFRKFDSK